MSLVKHCSEGLLAEKVSELNAAVTKLVTAEVAKETSRASGVEATLSNNIRDLNAAITAEANRAIAAEESLATTANLALERTNTLIGAFSDDKTKSARQMAKEEIAKVVASAPQDLDTLKEIADYIASDKTGAAEMASKIAANSAAIKKLEDNPSVIADDTLTQDGENPVKSKGIWSAIWGAIAAPAASVYEWVTTELKKKQDALSQERLAAVDSGITAEKVEKLDGIDLSGYAKTAEVLPRYKMVNMEWTADDDGDIRRTELLPTFYAVNYYDCSKTTMPYTEISLREANNGVSRDWIMVIDVPEGSEINLYWGYWDGFGEEYHPRGGDAANLEVVAGKRNVFFITEVQPNQFMVARDELELPDAGGGE